MSADVPRRIAHRGASVARPENSFAAFDLAIRQRCHAIELDVQRSRDGELFVHHDRTLSKVGGGRRRLRHVEASGLDALGLAHFDAVLARIASRVELLVEIKAYGSPEENLTLTDATVQAIRAARRVDRCWILCFDEALLERVATLEPKLRRVLNIAPPRRMTQALSRTIPKLDALSMAIGKITPAFKRAVDALDCPTMTYTCNTPRRLHRALELGIDGIMSDRPDWLLEEGL